MSEPAPRRSFSFGRVLLLVVPLGLLTWFIATKYGDGSVQDAELNLHNTMFSRLLGPGESATLAKDFQDADKDMVADPPSDAAKTLDPEAISFSYVASSDTEGEEETWKEFIAALEEKLKRDVNLVTYTDTDEQLRALKSGELHVTAFATGEAQSAVNEAGFVPLACFADNEGKYQYTMKIIVPADSPLKSVEDLARQAAELRASGENQRKPRMMFVRPRSNSGCTAALVMLMKEHDLQPERDYNWGFSYGHENSIQGVAANKVTAAAVASDILERMIASGEVKAEDVRTIYESDPYPPGVIGCAYNLRPELRDGIRETLVNFDWKGTGLEKTYGGSGRVKFAPVSYKDDWKAVHEINQAGKELLAGLAKPAA